MGDWNFLMNIACLRKHLYALELGNDKEFVLRPAGESVPWPVVWLLARYNRRHALAGSKNHRLRPRKQHLPILPTRCIGGITSSLVGWQQFQARIHGTSLLVTLPHNARTESTLL